MRNLIARLHRDEEGHAALGVTDLVTAVGAILLAVGAAEAESVLAYVGGVALAVGIFASGVTRHRLIDYDTWRRSSGWASRTPLTSFVRCG